jgi:RNA polymerase sigma-70 factor (ECF subfamily)
MAATAVHESRVRASAPHTDELADAVQVFLAERTRLLRVAYRIVGDAAAAEDVVQDAWLRWQRVDRRTIVNPAAFLTTATTHLAINLIQSARYRHEVPTEAPRAVVRPGWDPTGQVEGGAFATERILGFLLAKLSPSELGAFVLRKCFDYPYPEVAFTLGISVANARQLVCRAHVSMTGTSARRVDLEDHRALVAAFTAATEMGEMNGLLTLLGNAARKARRCGSSQLVSRTGRRPGRPLDQTRRGAGTRTKGQSR